MKARSRVVLAIAALFAAAAVVLAVGRQRPVRPRLAPLQITAVSARVAPIARAVRPIYRYSVIPGGIYSASELRAAIQRDPVLRDHYRDFKLESFRLVRLEQPRNAFVSFRKDDKIFWTQKPLRLEAGELLFTDGEHYARTRCGNQLSMTPVGHSYSSEVPDDVLARGPIANQQVGEAPASAFIGGMPAKSLRVAQNQSESSSAGENGGSQQASGTETEPTFDGSLLSDAAFKGNNDGGALQADLGSSSPYLSGQSGAAPWGTDDASGKGGSLANPTLSPAIDKTIVDRAQPLDSPSTPVPEPAVGLLGAILISFWFVARRLWCRP